MGDERGDGGITPLEVVPEVVLVVVVAGGFVFGAVLCGEDTGRPDTLDMP